MGILLWILMGAIAGAIAGAIMGQGKKGLIRNVIIGIIGANVGGFVADRVFGWNGITGFNLHSMLVAVGGSCLLLAIVRWISGKKES
jgi:uncharacterized membrane protein YeaQ/YmgE (transglycosylase-associated protein family)